MDTVRPCGCKGIRSCLICETEFGIKRNDLKAELQKLPSYVYCPICDKSWPGWDMDLYKNHPDHEGEPIEYPGVYIKLGFLDSGEILSLTGALDEIPWELSQSGRRKQNFGPKCNFKKRKLQLGNFNGFPIATQFVQEKFSKEPLLKDFQTIEQCTLEYDPLRGASIDPHIDDCWIWGERIVTVNVLGDSVLTMTHYTGPKTRYNLESANINIKENVGKNIVVRLPMPEGSLMVLYDSARYNWEHSILREDIKSKRICLAYRELTSFYLNSMSTNEDVHEICRRSAIFH